MVLHLKVKAHEVVTSVRCRWCMIIIGNKGPEAVKFLRFNTFGEEKIPKFVADSIRQNNKPLTFLPEKKELFELKFSPRIFLNFLVVQIQPSNNGRGVISMDVVTKFRLYVT